MVAALEKLKTFALNLVQRPQVDLVADVRDALLALLFLTGHDGEVLDVDVRWVRVLLNDHTTVTEEEQRARRGAQVGNATAGQEQDLIEHLEYFTRRLMDGA